ncbi:MULTISPECIES: WecB/TagA/CpsF family glycosyltransferase [unclassified Fibrobacter]|uniref:WecB/TagA/CpsF family glycosyltransferase n=1 Tax=unclassified Fibrobacter TaxID=2634177 RepID=UPI000933C218|nr:MULTISPECIES: WecB/TagA/CpsF family glycosyltransferase [unclassified Fibrobacter]
MKKTSVMLLNTRIDNYTVQELLEKLDKGVLVTPNVDDIMKHQRDEEFHRMADRAEFSVCDSKIVLLAAKLRGMSLKESIPGSSFFPQYCDYHAKNENIKIFLLGAKDGVGLKAMDRINTRIGRKIIVGAYSPPFGFEKNDGECEKILEILNASEANVVLVGLGNPKQTKWIYKFKDRLPNIDVFMALGATIDFEAGNVKRAPVFFQKLALEWLYRFVQEPKRLWHRYFVEDMPFFFLLLKQMLGLYRDPWKKTES